MDIRQMKYLIKIAESGNVTRAAEGLYISQSGLNQQLIRIEKELGVTIFDRTTHSLKVTDAGKIVLDYAREAVQREKQMRALVSDVADGTVGEIRLNLAMEHGVQIFCAVFPQFHKRYPKVALKLVDYIVSDQYDKLMKGELDIGMVMVSRKELQELVYIHLLHERFLLGVSREHPLALSYHTGADGDYPLMPLVNCREESFSLMFSGSTMRQVIDLCFVNAGYQPNILFETRTNHVAAMMVQNGICLTILPESQARLYPDIRWFRLPDNPVWECCLIYHRDNPPRQAGRFFIELAQDYSATRETGNYGYF